MTRLSVNINKIATLRNTRNKNLPDVQKVAVDCEKFGAQGITIHPRPDERHIRKSDVYLLKKLVKTEFNIEGYPSREFMDMVIEVKPEQVTLVPDSPDALTSNQGWDTKTHETFLREIILELKNNNIRPSIFVGTDSEIIEHAAKTGTSRIEFYTEPYSEMYHVDKNLAIKPFAEAANIALSLNLEINAGHDLNLENLHYFFKQIPGLKEVSIGHAIVCDALYYGLENTIKLYLKQLKE